MNSLKPRAAFQVLVMSEEPRFGREQIETAWLLKQIMDAGVRVFFYPEDRERTLDSAMEKMMLSLTNFASEMEREKARLRTRDAMQRKAARGYVAGGKVYGHVNREVLVGGRDGHQVRDHVERDVVPVEAEVVRRIFAEIAAGRGFSRIAKGLNADGVAAPRPGRGWAATGVRELVFRDLYRGRLVWGKTRWIDRGGTKVKQDRPESEWLVVEAPELRIVDEEAWRAAHARLDRTRESYLRTTSGRLWGRQESGLEARHLLTGFIQCAECGGSMCATRRSSQRGAAKLYYVCTAHRVRGDRVCANHYSAPAEALNVAIVRSLQDDVLTADGVEAVVRRALERHRARPDVAEEHRQSALSELRRLEDELRRYAEAIALSGPLPAILEALRGRERRRGELQAQLEHLDGLGRAADRWTHGDLAAEVRGRLAEWRAMLERQPTQGSQILRKLLEGRLTLTPRKDATGRFYDYAGRASYGRLLTGIVTVRGDRELVVPPE